MKVKVEGHENLLRDIKSNAIINTNISDFKLYMNRKKMREKDADEIRNACKEINNLKKELYEIKELIKNLGKK